MLKKWSVLSVVVLVRSLFENYSIGLQQPNRSNDDNRKTHLRSSFWIRAKLAHITTSQATCSKQFCINFHVSKQVERVRHQRKARLVLILTSGLHLVEQKSKSVADCRPGCFPIRPEIVTVGAINVVNPFALESIKKIILSFGVDSSPTRSCLSWHAIDVLTRLDRSSIVFEKATAKDAPNDTFRMIHWIRTPRLGPGQDEQQISV